MIARRATRLAIVGLLTILLMGVITAFAASNTVPVTLLSDSSRPITANSLKPAQCASLNLTTIVVGLDGTSGNDLILGTAGNDNPVQGGAGDDCIVGGAGNDKLLGQQGNDVLLGGVGDDDLNGGPGTDVCYAGGGTDKYTGCETELP